jgi:hypothetical protein
MSCQYCDCYECTEIHHPPIPREERERIRKEERHRKAVALWTSRSTNPEEYRDTRKKWWRGRAYRQIALRTAKYAEQYMADAAKPMLLLDKYIQNNGGNDDPKVTLQFF